MLDRDLLARAFDKRIAAAEKGVLCRHDNDTEILPIMNEMLHVYLNNLAGCFVEAGCYKGGSTTKFSIMAGLVQRKLYGFDSFQGMPENDEKHLTNLKGHSIEGAFAQGRYKGNLSHVKESVRRYGDAGACEFFKGWFEDTLPHFREKIAVVFLDVDLASSTRTCLKYLYPLIVPGGVLFSHDGLFPLVLDVFEDDEFWETEIGCKRPEIEGLRTRKLLRIVKKG